MDNFIWIPALIILLGVLVCFHELGHFIMAKLIKIRVEEFAFGFGPKWIVIAKRGDTEYTIRPFPLGGFVKLAGSEFGEDTVPDGFQTKPWWARWLVYAAGPFMSLLLAYIIFCVMGFTIGLPISDNVLNKVDLVEPKSIAYKAGLRSGDEIISIDGKPTPTGKQVTDIIHNSGEKYIVLLVNRKGEEIKMKVKPKTKALILNSLGFEANRLDSEDVFFRVHKVNKKSPAFAAGMKTDDKIISINGVKSNSGPELLKIVNENGNNAVTIVLDRKDEVVKVNLTPDEKKLKDNSAIAYIGFIAKQELQRVGIIKSIKHGNETTIRFIKVMTTVLFSKKVKDAVGGPIAIASETQTGVKRGAYGYLQLMAALSLSLGIFNLFPIPIVDGGQMLLLTIEGIRRKKFTEHTWAMAQIIGIAVLAVIFILVMTIDINRVVSGKMFK